MRRIVLILLLFLLIHVSFTGGVFAACIRNSGFLGTCSAPNSAYCPIGSGRVGGELFCCLTDEECQEQKTAFSQAQAQPISKSICDQLTNSEDILNCLNCEAQEQVWTALGCISTTPQGLMTTLLTFGIGIAGGLAFLLILIGGFQMMTSAGNPDQLNAGRELIGSAVTGLVLIIFSIFLLRLIGVELLRIPGFG